MATPPIKILNFAPWRVRAACRRHNIIHTPIVQRRKIYYQVLEIEIPVTKLNYRNSKLKVHTHKGQFVQSTKETQHGNSLVLGFGVCCGNRLGFLSATAKQKLLQSNSESA